MSKRSRQSLSKKTGKKRRRVNPDLSFDRVIPGVIHCFIEFLEAREVIRTIALLSKSFQRELTNRSSRLAVHNEIAISPDSRLFFNLRQRWPQLVPRSALIYLRPSGPSMRLPFLLGQYKLKIAIASDYGVQEEKLLPFADVKCVEPKVSELTIFNPEGRPLALGQIAFPDLRFLRVDGPGSGEIFSRAERLSRLVISAATDVEALHTAPCRDTILSMELYGPVAECEFKKWKETSFMNLQSLRLPAGMPLPLITRPLEKLLLADLVGGVDFGGNGVVHVETLEASFLTRDALSAAHAWQFSVQRLVFDFCYTQVELVSVDGFSSTLVGKAVSAILEFLE